MPRLDKVTGKFVPTAKELAKKDQSEEGRIKALEDQVGLLKLEIEQLKKG